MSMSDTITLIQLLLGLLAPLVAYSFETAHRRRMRAVAIAELTRQLSGDRFHSSLTGDPLVLPINVTAPRPRTSLPLRPIVQPTAPIETTVIELTGEQVKEQPKEEAKAELPKIETIAPDLDTTRLGPITIRPASAWQRPLEEERSKR